MATQVGAVVPGDESDVHDEPHIRGSRVPVRYVQARVKERGVDPETLAGRHDLDVADVYAALSYYHSHPGEMQAVEARHADATQEAADRSSLTPPDE